MRGRGLEMYRNESQGKHIEQHIPSLYLFRKKSVQSAHASSIWRNIHLFAEEESHQNISKTPKTHLLPG